MAILQGLIKELRKYKNAASEKFKESDAKELKNALKKINSEIDKFNNIKNPDNEKKEKFNEKIKKIFKSTCLKKYYKPGGSNETSAYKKYGVHVCYILQELYTYLTEYFGKNTAPSQGKFDWLLQSSISNSEQLKQTFEKICTTVNSSTDYAKSILFHDDVLNELFNICKDVRKNKTSASKPPQKPKQIIAQHRKPQRPSIGLQQQKAVDLLDQRRKNEQEKERISIAQKIKSMLNSLNFKNNDEQTTLNKLKAYFEKNADTIAKNILNKDYNTRTQWKEYIQNKPFGETNMDYTMFCQIINALFDGMAENKILSTTQLPEVLNDIKKTDIKKTIDNIRPTIGYHRALSNSISHIIDTLNFNKKLTSTEQLEFNKLKEYFNSSADTIAQSINNINNGTKQSWINYFMGKPFSESIDYPTFHRDVLSLFAGMVSDGILSKEQLPQLLKKIVIKNLQILKRNKNI
ncbi:MAG: hypothetical protein IJI84_04245 [Clostridia bacterium]|nr:hypothetical protein [Clostridia bacterium]